MDTLSIDIETYSSVDITKAGLYKYAQSADFDILLFGYAFNKSEVQVISLAENESMPPGILAALTDPGVIKTAWNAAFEWYCLSRWLGYELPIDQWRDTQLNSAYCGLPLSLAKAGVALGLGEEEQKLATGRALIKLFSCPQTPTRSKPWVRTLPHYEPEKWRLYKEYNARDVKTEMAAAQKLSPWPVPDNVQKEWELATRQNLRGVRIDRTLVEGARYCARLDSTEKLMEARALTGLDNPNSPAQLQAWLSDQLNITLANLDKNTVADLLTADLPPTERSVLELRQGLSKTSNKKYEAMQNAICEDGYFRGVLQFYGANRTGRYAGRVIQVQNLPRTHLDHLDLARSIVKSKNPDLLAYVYGGISGPLSQLIRTALIPSPGNVFVDADFSAIEARVIAWLAGEQWVLEVFRGHGKIYEATASQMFGVPLEKIVKGRPEYELRQRGKVATLALGYQGSCTALTAMDSGKKIADEEKPGLVHRWREANPNIVKLWYDLDKAAKDTVKTGRGNRVGYITTQAEVSAADPSLYFLTIGLPSGRKLFYARPRIGKNRWEGESIVYQEQRGNGWQESDTYGGKLAENITQAIARDILQHSINQLEAAGYNIAFHVHDEVVIDCLKDKADLAEVCRIMGQPVPWAPGLPLKADGWVGDYYTKD